MCVICYKWEIKVVLQSKEKPSSVEYGRVELGSLVV